MFQDDFEGDDFIDKWTSGGTEPNTISVIDGRVESRSNGQFIETIQEFDGNFRVEVDVEKVGDQDHGCWDFIIEIAALGGNSGVIRFDFNGFDGITLGQPCISNYVSIDSAGVNKGKAILTYSNPYLLFAFINDEGEVISAGAVYAGEFVTSKIAKCLAEIKLGLSEPVLELGNLEAVRDFTDVRDVVRAYWLLVNKCEYGRPYNIGSGIGRAIQEVVDRLLDVSGVEAEIRQDPALMRTSDVPRLVCDSSRFRQATGWAPEIDFTETMKDLFEYWVEKLS